MTHFASSGMSLAKTPPGDVPVPDQTGRGCVLVFEGGRGGVDAPGCTV